MPSYESLEAMLESCRQMEQTFAGLKVAEKQAEADQLRWDRDFLAMAEWYALRKSKDPSTKVGAVITRGREIVSLGYNGFARGVNDLPERYADRAIKYKLVVHAERNAMAFARQNLTGCTLYTWPFMPCPVCAGEVIQVGITRVVAPVCPPEILERWKDDLELSRLQFREAGVELVEVG